jgi:parallel beta-helix repeat protein
MSTSHLIAFMSYAHADDQNLRGRITRFREELSNLISLRTGLEFRIFQDWNEIGWGEQWKRRIGESIGEAIVLIPILTPRFFNSEACREELALFIEHERRIGRDDLILPVYLVPCDQLDKEKEETRDELARAIVARQYQYCDWRKLYRAPFSSPMVKRELDLITEKLLAALRRVGEVTEGTVGSLKATDRPEVQTSPAPDESIALPTRPREAVVPPANGAKAGPRVATEPITLVVDQTGRGDYTTIAEAMGAASPGYRIVVRPGVYDEGVELTQPMEIVGEGDRDDIVVQATGMPAVAFSASRGRVANLTLRHLGDGAWPAVDIGHGRLELEDCDITSQAESCVQIHDGADPRVRRNHIHHGDGNGVEVFDGGQGILEGNDIVGNLYPQVAVGARSNPTLRGNKIRDGKDVGVLVFEGGTGIFEENEVTGNGGAGVAIGSGADPVLRRNVISDGAANGVEVFDGGAGRILNNDISGNAGVGVFVSEAGTAAFEGNEIFGNALGGIWVESSAAPTFVENRIRQNKENGVMFAGDAAGTLEENTISRNEGAGIVVTSTRTPTLRRNSIEESIGVGVLVDGGQVILEGNEILGCGGDSVDIKANGHASLLENRIHDGADTGVFVHGGATATIERNRIFGSARAGVWVQEGQAEVRRNAVYGHPNDGIVVIQGVGMIDDNVIIQNGGAGIVIGTNGHVTARGNQIHDNGAVAVYVLAGGSGTIDGNDLRANMLGATRIDDGAGPLEGRNLE